MEAKSVVQQSLQLRRFVFMLAAFLPKIGRQDLVDNITVEEMGEDEYVVWLKAEAIGIDVGYSLEVPSICKKLKRPGLRVFTLEVSPGTRHSPPEDEDVTRKETFYEDQALVCVASLLAEVATRSLPALPDDLLGPAQIEEQAWE